MPSRWIQMVIVGFWISMTYVMVERDVLPYLGYGDMKYRTILANRAVEESVHWVVHIGDKQAGEIESITKPDEDGSYAIVTHGKLNTNFLETTVSRVGSDFRFDSKFLIGPLGKLDRFSAKLTLDGTDLELRADGKVENDTLFVSTKGLPFLSKTFERKIDPYSLTLDQLGPVDRLPGLFVGKTWTTRTINPLAALTSAKTILGGPDTQMETIENRVVGTDATSWKGRPWPCFVIEHRHGSMTATTWARIEDGKVLRQESALGGTKIVFELVPPVEKKVESPAP